MSIPEGRGASQVMRVGDIMVQGRVALLPLIVQGGYVDLRYDPSTDCFEYDGWGISRRYLLECYREIQRGGSGYMPAPEGVRINFGPRLTLYPAHCRELLDVASRFRRYIPASRRAGL